MYRFKFIGYLLILISLFSVLIFGLSDIKGVSCEPNCSEKTVGTLDPIGNTFSPLAPSEAMVVGQEYWLRIKVRGQDTLTPTAPPAATPAPNGKDIMIMFDGSSSMAKPVAQFKSSSTPTVSQLSGSKQAMKDFIDRSVGKNVYLGLGMNAWCRDYRQYSPELQIQWVYENYYRYVGDINLGAVFKPLQSIDSRVASYKATIDALDYYTYTTSDGNESVLLPCAKPAGGNDYQTRFGVPWSGGSTLGAALSIANFEFSNVLFDPDAIRPIDDSIIRTARGTTTKIGDMIHGGPRARDMTGTIVPKILILVSDGGDGVPPFYDDEEVDRELRNRYERLRDNNVTVYAITYARNNSTGFPRLQEITSYTGGTLYQASSAEEMVEKFDLLRQDLDTRYPPTPPAPTPGIANSRVIVRELVNSSNFRLIDPVNNTSFRISRETGAGETFIHTSMCADVAVNTPTTGGPDCITNKQYVSGDLVGYNVTLDPIGYGDTRYIYAKIVATTPGNNVLVDNPNSELEYPDLGLGPCPSACPDIDNTTVDISGALSYFQVRNGDVYSHAPGAPSIFSALRTNSSYFIDSSSGIVFARNSTDYGNGKISTSLQEVTPYTMAPSPYYDSYYEKFRSSLVNSPLDNPSSLVLSSPDSAYINPAVNSSTPLVLSSSWASSPIQGKKLLIFVPGNLYINSNISVASDGKSSLMFIVKGNLGIAPTVSRVQGIYMVDGRIDTECSGNFQSGNVCPPQSNASAGVQLTLEGVFAAQEGFNLDRTHLTNPAEIFIYRPDFLLSTSDSLGKNLYSWSEIAR